MMAATAASKSLPVAVRDFEHLPNEARLDIKALSILFDRSRASIYRDVKAGRLPAPVHSGLRSTRWTVGSIRKVLQDQAAGVKS